MAVTATPVFVQTPKITPITIVNADASNQKTACTAGSNGTKVTALFATSDDTSNRVIKVSLTRSATSYLMAAFTVTTLAGTDGSTDTVNLLDPASWPGLPIDNDGQAYLLLESGDTLTVASTTTVTSGKTVTVTCISGNL
jgi:hypothetical protein